MEAPKTVYPPDTRPSTKTSIPSAILAKQPILLKMDSGQFNLFKNGSQGTSQMNLSTELDTFLDFGKSSGISNIELVTKGAEGINRSMIKKYVAGMVNPYDQKAMLAANADDKFECHVLSESGIVVRNPLSCGILSAS